MKTILLIDSDEALLKNMAGNLTKLGYAVIGMQEGTTALPMIRQGMPIDLVVAEHRIDGTDCTEMLASIKKNIPQVPVIMITADPSIEVYLKALSSGIYEYLNKPVNMQELARIVKKALERKGRLDPVSATDPYRDMLLKHTA